METIAGVAIIPLIVGIVALIKKVGLPSTYAPIIAIILGIAIMSIESGFSINVAIQGMVIGLSASGLWSGTKTMINANK